MVVSCGPNLLEFAPGRRTPSPSLLDSISRSPWVDPIEERKREQQEMELDSLFVSLRSIQFGWMCRDDVFSIEAEASQNAFLRFDSSRRELNVVLKEAYPGTSEYVIAMRPSSILHISSHQSGLDAVIFLQLEIPPFFFHRPVPIPGEKRKGPFTRLDNLSGIVNNALAIPYTSLAMRLVLFSPAAVNAFAQLSDAANLRNIVKSHPVRVERRALFSPARLQAMDINIRQFDWSIAFQIEALLRNLYVDPAEILDLVPPIKKVLESHGKHYTAKLIKEFGPQAKEFLLTGNMTSISSYFLSFADSKQDDIESEILNDASYYHSLQVTISPTSIFLNGPFIDKSNRVLRRYSKANHENFLRVEFRDENNLQYRSDKDIDDEEFVRRRLGHFMHEGLVIAGRRFRFLAYSQSALREHSVWFVKAFRDPKHGIVNAGKIIESLGNFRDLAYDCTLGYCPARFGARVSQAFSATDAAIVEVDEILIKRDITTPDGQYTFTDGSGDMSADLARDIWHRIARKRDRNDFPRAYQIRHEGSKGMISVDYRLNGSNTLSLRDSMIKFDAPESNEIEVSRAIDQPTPYYLNRFLIMILEGLGVKHEVFQRFQDEAVRGTQQAMERLSSASHLLQAHGLGLSFKVPSTMANLSKLDLDNLARDPLFDQPLRLGVYHVLRDLKYKARIPIPNAWTLVGVADTHGYLKADEVFVCIKHPEKGSFYLEGPVLISRSPTIHPGDVQLAMAIGGPRQGSPFAREPLPNTVVFSVKGDRPLPSCLGGGDLDGDPYNIIPLRDHPYFTPEKTYEPANYEAAEKQLTEWPCTMKDVADFVMQYIVSDVIGVVATNWLIIADQRKDITDDDCLVLAKLHSDAVDYPKTGRPVQQDHIPRPRNPKPDWLAPETLENVLSQGGRYYESQTALGKLTRAIDLKAHEPVVAPQSRRKRPMQTATRQIESLADEFSCLSTNDSAISLICGALAPLIKRYSNPRDPVDTLMAKRIERCFKVFARELNSIALKCSLTNRLYKPLSEDELIVGTIAQKTSQQHLRKDKISKMKELTEFESRKVRNLLEGDEERTPGDYLKFAWAAWNISLVEMRKGTFGAKSFWWLTLGIVFDAIKVNEEAESVDVRSSRRGI
ncbi:hypothetical protein Agabi119p4_2114 [Agaricus bisporus var. burnettii]|uniref:RNA-dependent RNA polymerase n=1 Tax=Agaricus bisporus var. burnettii TaxID=192524 RepID=A0A8H7F8L5_AGABI|nr:hypothetical protein Agabi119p4_2114 [Agaricus bisporus var. burnettii]